MLQFSLKYCLRVTFECAGITWESKKDLLLPGYRQEWELTRPGGGEVVGVTGERNESHS